MFLFETNENIVLEVQIHAIHNGKTNIKFNSAYFGYFGIR